MSEYDRGSWDGGTDARTGIFHPRSRVHRGGERRNCWSAPAGPVHGCETESPDHHRDPPGTGSGGPQASSSSRAVRGLSAVRILCFQNQAVLFSDGLWIVLAGRCRICLCTLASHRCYPAPFRLNAPLLMGTHYADPGRSVSLGYPIERGTLGPAGTVASRVSAGQSMAEEPGVETELSVAGLGHPDPVSTVR